LNLTILKWRLAKGLSLALTFCLLLARPAACSQLSDLNPGTRAEGMAEAGAAALPGPESLFYNPAAALGTGSWQFLFSESNWAAGVAQGNAALLAPSSGLLNLGLAAAWERWGDIESRDAAGNLTGMQDANALQLGLNAALAQSSLASLGLRLGLDQEPLEARPDYGLALGGSSQWNGWGIGLFAQDSLKGRLKSQLSLSKSIQAADWTANLNGGGMEDGWDSRAGAGLELGWSGLLFFRAGWSRFLNEADSSGQFSLGLGFKPGAWSADYALLSLGELGLSHRFQVSVAVPASTPTPVPVPSPTATPSPSPTLIASPTPTQVPSNETPKAKKEVEIKFLVP
jgi:hypothetical protein